MSDLRKPGMHGDSPATSGEPLELVLECRESLMGPSDLPFSKGESQEGTFLRIDDLALLPDPPVRLLQRVLPIRVGALRQTGIPG